MGGWVDSGKILFMGPLHIMLRGLQRCSLSLRSISGSYLLFGTFYGDHCLSHDLTGFSKLFSRKVHQLTKLGNRTVHG